VLSPTEVRELLSRIEVGTHAGLRDRALIGLMVYSFARIGAALAMKRNDVFMREHRLWVRLQQTDGTPFEIPCHRNLETYLRAYLESCGGPGDGTAPLFRTISRTTRRFTGTPLPQADAYAMIRRRARSVGINIKIGNHTFRASGITAYLENGGSLNSAAAMANHASTRTTRLYDRRRERSERNQ
jgi:integrase/recombinase XerC